MLHCQSGPKQIAQKDCEVSLSGDIQEPFGWLKNEVFQSYALCLRMILPEHGGWTR